MEAESSSVGAQGGIRGGRRDSCCFSVDASPNPSFKAPGSRRSFTARKGSVAGADSSRRGSLVDASRRRGSMAGADGTRRGSLAGVDEGGRVSRRGSVLAVANDESPPKSPPSGRPPTGSFRASSGSFRDRSRSMANVASGSRRGSLAGAAPGFRRGSLRPLGAGDPDADFQSPREREPRGPSDPLDEDSRRLLGVPAAQRDTALLTQLVKLTNNLAVRATPAERDGFGRLRRSAACTHAFDAACMPQADYFSSLTEAQHRALAKAWRYQWFAPGADICLQEEEVTDFFIVIEGSCLLNERQIHHLEGRTGTEGFKRVVDCRRGRGFGHYPLIFGEAKYDYSATVVEKTGCCVLLVPKADYVHVLRKEVEKQMKDTVALLKANKTFSDWSHYALNRFYFWFKNRSKPSTIIAS